MSDPATITRAAFELVVRSGLAELTLRPLADRAGTTLPAITSAMGPREALISRLVETAMAQDEAFRSGWSARVQHVLPCGQDMRAIVAEAVLDDWTSHHRHLPCMLIDMIQMSGRDGQGGAELERWLARAGEFWAWLLFDDPAMADLALGYMIDEAGFSLAAADIASYRIMRAMGLRRLIGGIFPISGEDPGWSARLEHWIALLAPAADARVAADRCDDRGDDRSDTKRERIATQAGRLIVGRGVEAVTHRSVAAEAGVPASTVVYHFGSREALVVAGLHAIVTNFRQGLAGAARPAAPAQGMAQAQAGRDDYAASRDLVRATSIIAIAASRYPGLSDHAIDMRRRRGENFTTASLEWLGLPGDRGFDRATGQALSIALFGMRMVAMARGLSERDHVGAGLASLVNRIAR